MASIAIIDYGMGNLHSIGKAVEHVAGDQRVWVTSDVDTILRANRVIFPGVGAIRDTMAELKRLGLDDVLRRVAEDKPLLGVCLGMQAMLDFSDENEGVECMGLIPGKVSRFPESLVESATGERLKVPHMGWNQMHQCRAHPLWKEIEQDSRFYFVHSYHVDPQDPLHTIGSTHYGIDFTAAVARENLFAVQCHPEKSQHAGLQLLANFARWNGTA